jgi:radical SAM protein with 4Fe4S-binding SPASM domain
MCPQGRGLMTRPKGDMFQKLVWNIREQAYKLGVKGIRYTRWGEPTLSKAIDVALTRDMGSNTLIHIHTNGYLEYDQIAHLLKADSVKFSLQGTTAEEYKAIRGNEIDSVFWACHTLFYLREHDPKPYITVGTTSSKNQNMSAELLRLFSPCCDSFTCGETKDLTEERDFGRIVDCPEVNSKLSINWDGTVSACCADYNNEMVVGDLNKQTLKEIWEGTKLQQVRDQVSQSRLAELPVCRRCQHVQ